MAYLCQSLTFTDHSANIQLADIYPVKRKNMECAKNFNWVFLRKRLRNVHLHVTYIKNNLKNHNVNYV